MSRMTALPLLAGFVFVVGVLDLIMTGAIPKWAIFAPIFVPLLMRLNVEPEAVLAAYRVGDSPFNAVTPLNAYFGLIVAFAMKYQKDAGVGTVIALPAAAIVGVTRPVDIGKPFQVLVANPFRYTFIDPLGQH